jgi:hypothetical protein
LIEKINITNKIIFLRFSVKFNSKFSHEVNWLSNETLITSNEKYKIINDATSTSLVINSVDKNDQHDYSLIISNKKDKVSYKTYLFVEGMPFLK